MGKSYTAARRSRFRLAQVVGVLLTSFLVTPKTIPLHGLISIFGACSEQFCVLFYLVPKICEGQPETESAVSWRRSSDGDGEDQAVGKNEFYRCSSDQNWIHLRYDMFSGLIIDERCKHSQAPDLILYHTYIQRSVLDTWTSQVAEMSEYRERMTDLHTYQCFPHRILNSLKKHRIIHAVYA